MFMYMYLSAHQVLINEHCMLAAVQYGNDKWNSLKAPEEMLYPWDPASTYIKSPPFFHTMVS